MDMQIGETEKLTKVTLAGRLDTAGATGIEPAFAAQIAPKAHSVIIDVAAVTFIASQGIRMLISAARDLSQKGARLVLYGANENVTEIIETAGLADIIAMAESEPEALGLAMARL